MANRISHRFINPNGKHVDEVPVHLDAIGAVVDHTGAVPQATGVSLTLNTEDGRSLRLVLDDATLDRIVASRAAAQRRLSGSDGRPA